MMPLPQWSQLPKAHKASCLVRAQRRRTFIRAIHSAGGTIPPIVIADIGAQAEVSQLGSLANGLDSVDTGLASTDTSNPSVSTFDRFMNQVSPSVAKDAFAENAYLGVLVFAKAAQSEKAVTAYFRHRITQ